MRTEPLRFQEIIKEAFFQKASHLSLSGFRDHMELRGDVLFEVPTSIYAMTNLRHLDLNLNQLSCIPKELERLHTLDVSFNPLVRPPKVSGLILDSGQYSRFADEIDPGQIYGLIMRRRELAELDQWLSGPLTHLQLLRLRYMELSALPPSHW